MSGLLLVLYLLSSEPEIHRLERWYLAPLLPIFFAALAVADKKGVYQTATEGPLEVSPGQMLRVSVYWEALAAP